MLPPLTEVQQTALVAAHREAAALVGQKKYLAGIRALRTIARDYPMLAAVHHQLGVVLARTGRLDEAADALRTALELQPDAIESVRAWPKCCCVRGDVDAAWLQRGRAGGPRRARRGHRRARGRARDRRARGAGPQGRRTPPTHTPKPREAAVPTLPVRAFIRGRLLFDAGLYADAATELQQAVEARRAEALLPELHLTLGEALAKLERYDEAEVQYRDELAAFPRSLQAYASLAMLYRATNREADVEAVLNELVAVDANARGLRAGGALVDRARATAHEPTRSGPMPARASGAIRRWRFSGPPGDKRQADGGPEQAPHLSNHRQRHAGRDLHRHAAAPARPTTPRPRRRGRART